MSAKSNKDLAALLELRVEKLRESDEDAQPEIAREILEIAADMKGTESTEGALITSGRVTYGNRYGPAGAGASGLSVIAFDDPSVVEDDA